jgi:hypothetical protein
MSSATVESPPPPLRRRPAWALPAVVLAVLAVVAAAVVGVRGLLADPLVAVAPDGSASISGSWEPFDCGAGCVQGYVQAGARSVFVRLPAGCPAPRREAHVSLRGRPDHALGSHAYLATSCPSG